MYSDRVSIRRLEWILENADRLDLGKSYVKGQLVGGEAQTEIIRKYLKRAIMFEGEVPQAYFQHDNCGRRFSREIGLTNLSRKIRHTISEGLIDIDVKNAHPVIKQWICRKHNVSCPLLDRYISNRDEMLNELSVARDISKDGAKKMLLRAINRDDGRFQQTQNDPDWLYDYHQECKITTETLTKLYPEYFEQAVKSKQRKNQEAWNMKGSALNRHLCVVENGILEVIEQVVQKHNGVVRVLAYDGCMIEDTFSPDELNQLLRDIEETIPQTFPNLILQLSQKVMNEGFQVPDSYLTKKERKLIESRIKAEKKERKNKEDDLDDEYDEWKFKFEQTHCKIIDPVSILYTNSLGEYEFISIKDMEQKYFHVENFYKFIWKWWADPTMRVYKRADIYAPTQQCPSDVFNLWKPYPYENKKVEMTPELNEKLEMVINHIRILANHQEDVFQYLMDWLAQFLQYPHIKTTMLCFTSNEGAGKDTFIHLIRKLLGKGQVVETSRPEDVFGRFNDLLANCRLVALNEMSAGDLYKFENAMKMTITESDLVIESKGKPTYKMNSFLRLILLNNAVDSSSIKTSSTDRRKLLIRCSDEKIGDGNYFNTLYRLMDEDDVLISLFNLLMARDVTVLNDQRGRVMPKTEYQAVVIENYGNPVEDWIRDLCVHNIVEGQEVEQVDWTISQQLASFQSFCSDRGIKWEMNARTLTTRLSLLKIDGITKYHKRTGSNRIFHFKTIEAFFKK